MGIFRQFPYTNFHDLNLDWLLENMRNLLTEWAEYQEKWNVLYEDIESAFNDFKAVFDEHIAKYDRDFQTFINSINVTTELRKVFDQAIADGTVNTLINPIVVSTTTNWLENNITEPTGVVIDKSLSIDGACADAKATGHEIRRLNKENAMHGYINQYNFLDYEYIQGYYNAQGDIISSANHRSYIIPIKTNDKIFYTNANASIAVLGYGKTFLGLADKEQISQPVVNTEYTIQSYKFDISKYDDAVFVSVPRYQNDFMYVRSATYHKMLPILPINSDSTCIEYQISLNNNEVIYPKANKPEYIENQFMNILTGQMSSMANRITTKFMVLKKDTIISCKYSNMAFYLRGMTGSNVIVIGAQKYLKLGADFIGTIDYITAGWVRPGYAPQNVTNMELSYFLEFITPEEQYHNKWTGKTWYCYGTSLSDIGIDDEAGNNGYAGKYPLYVDELSGLNRINGAIGSGGIRTDAPHGGNVLQALLQTPFDCDLVTLECLPNDEYDVEGKTGEITDTGTTTICGAFKTACEYITRNTRARMCVIFVTGWINNPSAPMDYTHMKYVEAKNKLIQIANLYGVEVIDAEKEAIDYGHRSVGLTYQDHIHLNYLGGKIVGDYVWSKLKDIEPYPTFQNN